MQAFVFITTPPLIPFILQCVFSLVLPRLATLFRWRVWERRSAHRDWQMDRESNSGGDIPQWWNRSHSISINDEQCWGKKRDDSGDCVIMYLHDKHVIRMFCTVLYCVPQLREKWLAFLLLLLLFIALSPKKTNIQKTNKQTNKHTQLTFQLIYSKVVACATKMRQMATINYS